MSITKKMVLVIVCTLSISLSIVLLFPKELTTGKGANHLRIGAGDDASGLLLEQIKSINKSIEIDTIIDEDIVNEGSKLETLQFKDC